MIATLASLERKELPESEARKQFPDEYRRFAGGARYPLVVGLPGVAPRYCRTAYKPELRDRIKLLARDDPDDRWSNSLTRERDDLKERSAIESMVAHRSVAESTYGLLLPSVTPEAFIVLAELERHFIDGEKGPTIGRLLEQLNDACSNVWTDSIRAGIGRASKITAFTNFPIGLIRLPGDTSPLATRVPIVYRPLLPLTRALQQEFSYRPGIQLAESMSVLIAECIPREDRIGAYSRDSWNALLESAADYPGEQYIDLHFAEISSLAALRAEIARVKPTMLLISAHGGAASGWKPCESDHWQ